MQKYKNFQEFQSINQTKFATVQALGAKLKAPKDLGKEGGFLLAEAEELEHLFLNGAGACTDLMFGLSASVLDAKAHAENQYGLLYGMKSGNATDKKNQVDSDPIYLAALAPMHELEDLKKYLERKHDDFMANHYFYKQFRAQK